MWKIMQARKTLLFEVTTPWIKKSTDDDFDFPMGCFDDAEKCELAGAYIQSKLVFLKTYQDLK